jgi:uncharacterized protein YneF (UPF0154 family)
MLPTKDHRINQQIINPMEMMCGGRRPTAAQIQLLLRQLKSKTGREERKLPDKN